ncbi:Hypothetical protein A7982_11150 [Minicystis rosea]|nr:Hypothetical protein A7982_11150 [Minicystis rosea]
MSRPDLEPLDADLDALLAAERDRPPAAPDAHDRVLARVMTTLGPGGGSPPPAGAPPGSSGLGSLLTKPILLGAALGSIVAAVIVTRPDVASAPPVVVIATAEPITSASPITAPALHPTTEPLPAPPPAGAGAGGAPSLPRPRAFADESARDASLAAERRLLEEALRALGEGRSAAALELLERHVREFPRGRLGEEREALFVRALARAGRVEEARARASHFRASHPNSILLPAIEATLGPIP